MTVEVKMPSLRGLYAITDSTLLAPDQLVDAVGHAIAGGAVMVQYRDKNTHAPLRLAQAIALQTLCASRNVPLIINDDVALALASGAAGVHLGRDDTNIAAARTQLGADAIIGISCYNRLDLAQQAAQDGANYIAFGRFFPSSTKPEAEPADLQLLTRAHQQIPLPVCAIGGITVANAPALLAAGADLLAVIHGVFGQPNIRTAASEFRTLFQDR